MKTVAESMLGGMEISDARPDLQGTRPTANAEERVSLLAAATLTTWLTCLVVGIVGFCIPYARPTPEIIVEQPVQVELLKIQLTTETLAPPETTPPPALSQPPALKPVPLPQMRPATLVAQPSPSIAFAIPVAGPTITVDASQSSHARAEGTAQETPATLPAQTQVYGKGEGRQPAPKYPPLAMHSGQEGTVGIRFSVGINGRVTTAEVISSSAWPLLNEAALHVVRDKWRFGAGPPRLYDVSVRFKLSK